MTYQISCKFFCAGIVTNDVGKVIKAAPIVRYFMRWDIEEVKKYCQRRKFKLEAVNGQGIAGIDRTTQG